MVRENPRRNRNETSRGEFEIINFPAKALGLCRQKSPMRINQLVSAWFLWLSIASAIADPISELKSPDPRTRDMAASTLRLTYVATPRSQFDRLSSRIHAGLSKRETERILGSYAAVPEKSIGSGMTASEIYRLDPAWTLEVWSLEGSEKIEGAKLVAHTEKIWVQPPKGFKGTWIEYYANGQKMYEERHGDSDGVNQVFYYDNGRPWCVSTNTENTYYFRDGRVQPEGHIVGVDD